MRAHTLVSKYVAVQMHTEESVKGPVINFNSILAVTGARRGVMFQGATRVQESLAEAFEQGVDVFVGGRLAPGGVVLHVHGVICSRHGAHGACTAGHLS